MSKTYKGKEKHKFLKLFQKREEKRNSKRVFYFVARKLNSENENGS